MYETVSAIAGLFFNIYLLKHAKDQINIIYLKGWDLYGDTKFKGVIKCDHLFALYPVVRKFNCSFRLNLPHMKCIIKKSMNET